MSDSAWPVAALETVPEISPPGLSAALIAEVVCPLWTLTGVAELSEPAPS